MTAAVATAPQAIRALSAMMDPVTTDHTVEDFAHRWVLRLIETEGNGILRLLWRILGREQDVLDAYQDCFCRLAALPERPNLRCAKAYIYRTAANIAIEMIRARTRRRAHLPRIITERKPESEESIESTTDSDRNEELRRRVANLPPHLRNVIVLRDLNRMSYQEVSRILGIDPATARVYRRHAVVRLAELFGGSHPS